MLDSLFVTPAISAIDEALRSAAAEGKLAVVGNAKLAAALAKRGPSGVRAEIVAVGLSERAAKKFSGPQGELAAIDAGTLAGVVGVDVTTDEAWQATLREWARVTRDGGTIVLVDRGRAPEASRRALCAGLTELEQRRVGRVVITSGLVTHL